jgi:hypothetical protein
MVANIEQTSANLGMSRYQICAIKNVLSREVEIYD